MSAICASALARRSAHDRRSSAIARRRACARFRFAREILRRRFRFGEFRPLLRGERARALERQRQFVARREIGERGFVLRLALGRFAPLRLGARQRFVERRQARQRLGAPALGRGELVARRVECGPRRARALGGRRSRRSPLRASAAWALPASARASAAAWRAASASRDRSPSRFFSTSRCAGGRRRFGGGDETVPAPQVALERHQPLPGFQPGRQTRAVGAGDDADLRQPALQRRRRLDAPGERLDALRQFGIALAFAERPMRRRGGVDRGLQIVAERGAERRLVAARDVDRVDRRPPLAARRRADQLGQRADFGVDALGGALGLGERPARARFRLARFAHARASAASACGFGVGERLSERLDRLGFGAQRGVLAGGGLQFAAFAGDRLRIRSRTARAGASPRRGRRRARCGAR